MTENVESQNRQDNAPAVRAWPLLLLGVAISLMALLAALRPERIRIEDEVARTAGKRDDELLRGVERDSSMLALVRVFFELSETIGSGEFDHFASECVSMGPGVQAVEWVPSISGLAGRRALEERESKRVPGCGGKV